MRSQKPKSRRVRATLVDDSRLTRGLWNAFSAFDAVEGEERGISRQVSPDGHCAIVKTPEHVIYFHARVRGNWPEWFPTGGFRVQHECSDLLREESAKLQGVLIETGFQKGRTKRARKRETEKIRTVASAVADTLEEIERAPDFFLRLTGEVGAHCLFCSRNQLSESASVEYAPAEYIGRSLIAGGYVINISEADLPIYDCSNGSFMGL
jgi:hypothetical protein